MNDNTLCIRGGFALKGRIPISGAKNAALPLMASALLTDQPLYLSNVPNLLDITMMCDLLAHLGVAVTRQHNTIVLQAYQLKEHTAPYDLVARMRASVLVLGPLLARDHQATVSLPGGCAIGARPVDLHIKGLQQMGASITVTDGYIKAKAPQGLLGASITFPFISVGATENLVMAATLAHGTTILRNCAREPEITDLCHCLIGMGAQIEGIGTDTLIIYGQQSLQGTQHCVIQDRIELGTYAMAAAITHGDVVLTQARLDSSSALGQTLQQAGCIIEPVNDGVRICRANNTILPVDVTTEPYPGFATDLQAQLMALVSCADGTSTITETIFENRFMHVPELNRLGANIQLKGNTALIRGVKKLTAAPVQATDLRASVSLVLVALVAEGTTSIGQIYHLDRGYEKLEEKLNACGAHIERRHL